MGRQMEQYGYGIFKELYFIDEAGFDINMRASRAWTPRGSGKLEYSCTKATSKNKDDQMRGFYFIIDNTPIHKQIEDMLNERNRDYKCVFFPPYSPELNPIEQFWALVKRWLNSASQGPSPNLDYFIFDDTFQSFKHATNSHYLDLLTLLSNKQSNKLTKIAQVAQNLFDTRSDGNSKFGKRYADYWDARESSSSICRIMQSQGQETIIILNELTIARQVHGLGNNTDKEALVSSGISKSPELKEVEAVDSEVDEGTENEVEDETPSSTKSGTDMILHQTANLASDQVGKPNIVDLPSISAKDILKSEIGNDRYNLITKETKLEPVTLSTYATELSNALNEAPLSLQMLRQALYKNGSRSDFDLIAHHDAGFIEATTRYFLGLMSSPQNPINKTMLERTSATYLIIYLVNQLFLSNNVVIELGWLEREFYLTDRSKFDDILFKIGNKSIAPALIEFSGGINDRTSSHKNSNDIKKLCRSMTKIMKDTNTDQMFCMRCYGPNIYFEKLHKYDGVMYRSITANIDIPNAPIKLKAFIQKVLKLLA
ncbi:hypothetical protein G6F43_002512 [Rhizopus delemar]|nr:hypothetical protein G6F43_002512 [Rhizopus delemar]